MLAKLFLQYFMAVVFGIGMDEGYATVFGTPGDPHDGDTLACDRRPIPQDESLCAHRWLPCGTRILVLNLERPGITSCRVADRGPFGVDRGTGRWRGIIDLAPKVARDLRLDGRDLVRLVYKLPPPGHKVYENTAFLTPRRIGPAL
ncbi:MAG: hypothetical protein HY698_14775 [Deltaproteobacteria bacterium]|nr:hypothetical protein [Deltaproteobacteria bacterium]